MTDLVERLRALVAEARAMFEWLSVAESHLASDAWLADYIAKSAVERPAVAVGDSVDTLDRFECAFCGKKFATSTFALRRLLHPQIGSLGPRLEGRKGLNGCISAYQQHEPDTCRYG
jgi:hypothetical protein